MDDVLIWGKDKEEHDFKLKAVFNRAKKYNLKLNKQKWEVKTLR